MIKVCPILISQKPVNITSGIHGQGRRLTRTELGSPGTLKNVALYESDE